MSPPTTLSSGVSLSTAATNSPHTMTHLLLWLFILYGVLSLFVAAARSGELSRPRGRAGVVLAGAGAYWFLFDAIEAIQPELLRLFGAGGQGFLHLLSLRFVDPRDLSVVGVASRVLAGSYTAILAAIFFLPLMGALLVFVWNLYEAFDDSSTTTSSRQGGGDETTRVAGDLPLSLSATPAAAAAARLFHQPHSDPLHVSLMEDRWLLKEFDMTKFLVLCPLGKGVTSRVVLAKVRRPGENVDTPAIQQTGIFWESGGGGEGDVFSPALSAATTSIGTGNGHLTPSQQPLVARKQTGNLWDPSVVEEAPPLSLGPSAAPAPAVLPVSSAPLATASPARPAAAAMLVVGSPVPPPSTYTGVAGGASSARRMSGASPAFGPTAVPAASTGGVGGSSPSLDLHDQLLDSLLTRENAAASNTPPAPTGPPRPFSNSLVSAQSMSGGGGNLKHVPSRVHIRTSESIMNLRDLAGPDVDEWQTKPQFLDADQRKKSHMDDVFTVAPGLSAVPRNISDFSLSARVMDEDANSSDALEAGPHPTTLLGRGGASGTSLGLLNSGLSRDDILAPPATVVGGGAGAGSETSSLPLGRSPKLMSVKFSSAVHSARTRSVSSNDSLGTDEVVGGGGSGGGDSRPWVDGLDAMPELVAVKIMCKSDIERMGMRRTVENERKALASCASPFVCNILGAFQDMRWAYLLLEPVPAGDLAGLLEQRQVMFEEEARFYVGCLLLALEHLHHRGITCLDVKPENMLLDQWGYCKLCDLGIARVWKPEQSGGATTTPGSTAAQPSSSSSGPSAYAATKWEFVGTPEYMSPEVVERQNIEKGVAGVSGPDLWATGVLLFELLVGEPPFAAQTNAETLGLIRSYVRDYNRGVFSSAKARSLSSRWGLGSSSTTAAAAAGVRGGGEDDFDPSILTGPLRPLANKPRRVASLICKLLCPDVKQRLGCQAGGARAVMENAWFRDFEWDALRLREMRAPFIPNPLTLAPPFRGEDVSLDITRAQPMTVSEVQEVQNFLRKRDMSRDELTGAVGSGGSTWRGFIQVKDVATSGGGAGTGAGAGAREHLAKSVVHFKELFRDEDE